MILRIRSTVRKFLYIMKFYALIALAALSMAAIPAMADEHSSYWLVTTVCIVYDNGNEARPDCEVTNEYVEIREGPPPPTVDVTIPEGALFPDGRNTDIYFSPSSIGGVRDRSGLDQ